MKDLKYKIRDIADICGALVAIMFFSSIVIFLFCMIIFSIHALYLNW